MAATKYDFDIEKGSSFRISIIYKDSEGNPVDLTNWCARLVWKTNLNVTQSFSTENLDESLYKFFIDGPNAKLTLKRCTKTEHFVTRGKFPQIWSL